MISIGHTVKYSVRQVTNLVGWVKPDGIARCLCGAKPVLWVQEDYVITTSKWTIVVPNLIFQRCISCHETYLGHRALDRIEKATEWTRKK